MNAHTEVLLELCAGYELGILDAADRARLEEHLAEGCPQCEAELRRLSESMLLLAAAAPQHPAPAAVRDRVLAAVRAEAGPTGRATISPLPRRERARTSPLTWVWAAAAVLLAVAALALWRNAQRTSVELAQVHTDRARLERELAEERRWAATLTAPAARVVALAPTPAAPSTAAPLNARVMFDPATHRALAVFENFAPPAGHDYQLWAISDHGPSSLGVVHADSSGRAVVRIENTGDPAKLGAFAVSLENAGGAPTPTAPAGPVVMVGKL